MATSGQTINDRLNAVRYALVGQGLARTVCKASTEEVLGPKRKHIEYLIACTNEPNVSIPQLANLLIERTQHSSWAVVFKSLISIHHLMSYGNDRFSQYLATSNHSFELADFMDRTTPQGYNMSTFVRRYSKYINEKSISYRTLAVDVCKVRSCKQLPLRTMNMDNLSKNMPPIEAQMDALLDFGATVKDLNNGIIKSAFRLLYKDLVRLYIAYQEAIINLMERFFKLNRKRTRDAYELYKRFLKRMERLGEFLQLVDEVGLDKSEMPDLLNIPSSLLPALEHHLEEQEAKKRGGTATSPELRGGDDEEEAENNENEPEKASVEGVQSSSVSPTVAVEGQQSVAGSSSAPEKKSPQAGSSTGAAHPEQPEKQVPPQKPARPSPKASPKSSPTKPKPPNVKPPVHPAQPAVQPAKSAAPPQRPAKPPSRPPPPSAAAASPAVPAAPTPVGGSSATEPAQSGSSTGSRQEQSQVKVVAHTPPPPHPPPPHPTPPSHPPPPTQKTSNENSVTTNNVSSTNNDSTEGNGEEDNSNTAPTCSSSARQSEPTESNTNESSGDVLSASESNHANGTVSSPADVAQVEAEEEEELNHVNSNNNVREAEEHPVDEIQHPPSPPPPIDDEEVEPPPPLPEPDHQEAQPQEPMANGQNNDAVVE